MSQAKTYTGLPLGGLWVLLVLVVFHAIASLRAWGWDSVDFADTYWRISPDLWVLLTVASLLCLKFGFRWYFGLAFAVALAWIPLYRVPYVVFPEMFGKTFVLTEEVGQVGGLWIALFDGGPDGVSIWTVVLVAGIGLLTLVILYLLWRTLGRQLEKAAYSLCLLGIAAAVLATSFAEKSRDPGRESRLFSRSMYASTLQQLNFFIGRASLEPRIKYAHDQVSRAPQDLGRLKRADLILVFVESYGRSLLAHDRYGPVMRQILADARATLEAAGHGAISCWIESPVTGSQSQAAHASFISGIPIRSYRDHEMLMNYDARMLTHILGDLGYHCVNAQPKLEIQWPESHDVLGFHEDLFGVHTPYRADGGPIYHWAAAPDQYPLALAIEKFMKPSDKPVFLQLIAGISHAPYSLIPPYIEDWQAALDPKAYQPVKTYPFTFLDYHRGKGVEDAYIATLNYTFEMLAGFVSALPRPAIVMILGDHQAPRTGSISPAVTDYAVPFHIMSNRNELLDPIRTAGFVEGMVPGGKKVPPMHEFLHEFLRAYHRK
ncbi:MAG: hypothetical protein VX951_13060 [Planctomycetota bacterium]|nr:hypothetical protein [Planctomycetota bacterium]